MNEDLYNFKQQDVCIISKWKIIDGVKIVHIYLYRSKNVLIFRETKYEWKTI